MQTIIFNDQAVSLSNYIPSSYYTTTAENKIDAELDYDKIFKEIASRLNKIPVYEHKCKNCGGILQMEENNHIFKCPYCGTCYAI